MFNREIWIALALIIAFCWWRWRGATGQERTGIRLIVAILLVAACVIGGGSLVLVVLASPIVAVRNVQIEGVTYADARLVDSVVQSLKVRQMNLVSRAPFFAASASIAVGAITVTLAAAVAGAPVRGSRM